MANEKRLIDADRLEKVISKHRSTYCFKEDVIADIAKQPTVDAVEVVRCKDCRYWENGDCYRLELSRQDDFCSYGERKDCDD